MLLQMYRSKKIDEPNRGRLFDLFLDLLLILLLVPITLSIQMEKGFQLWFLESSFFITGMFDHRLFMGEVDQNICNLSQLPLLPSFNQRHHSKFRDNCYDLEISKLKFFSFHFKVVLKIFAPHFCFFFFWNL